MDNILSYLKKNYLHNFCMIELLNRKEARIFHFCPKGVTIVTSTQIYLVCCDDLETYIAHFKKIENLSMCVIHHEFALKSALEFFPNLQFMFKSYNAVYLNKTPPILNSSLVFKVLDMKYFNFICDNYHSLSSKIYIQERINSEVMIGGFIDNQCIGFIGLHDEGSMGMLEVLPQYQHKGYAISLMNYYINKFINQGFCPYSQIIVDNIPSINLHKKIGMDISGDYLIWLMEN